MLVEEGEDRPEAAELFRVLPGVLAGGFPEALVQLGPDFQQAPEDLQLVELPLFPGEAEDGRELPQNAGLPVHRRGEFGGGEARAVHQGVHIFGAQHAALEPPEQPGVEGEGQVVAVLAGELAAGVEGVGVAEEALPRPQLVAAVVDPVLHGPLQHQGELDLPVPVPGKPPVT